MVTQRFSFRALGHEATFLDGLDPGVSLSETSSQMPQHSAEFKDSPITGLPLASLRNEDISVARSLAPGVRATMRLQ